MQYSERETRLIVAWVLITFSCALFIFWATEKISYARPPYIIDLLLPAMMAIAGAYVLKRKIPDK